MQNYECENCGYDMTGINKFDTVRNTLQTDEAEGEFPVSLMSNAINSVPCRSCGQVGKWIKSQ
ncbi:MAG: hypothetical protein ATN35_02740 [Epulopiscium sp. Nele67-Bin004]|nr:MAG: hypothetical protein ATN35_02740 [Epulopiscium sp. Nele67-Bin004]